MGRNGKVNIQDLEKFRNNLERSLNESEMDAFMESCAKELAARLLAKVIKITPTGQYPKGSGKKGGTLKRGWTGGQQQAGAEYAQSLKVHHYGSHYVIEVVNPVEYASYVEFGHRTRNHAGWVEGKFMLTISEQEIQNASSRILQNKLKKKLGECFR